MYGILGEDKSDVDLLDTLVRRIAKKPNLKNYKKGYTGCAELLCKGAKQIKAYKALGVDKFIICYDSDRSSAQKRYSEIVDCIIKKSGIAADFCALIPVQEIESWILADLDAISKVITSWRPPKEFSNPEAQNDPKELLEKLSRGMNNKPLYSHATHNPRVAEHLNLEIIVKKCVSALPLFEFVQRAYCNYPAPIYASEKDRKVDIIRRLTDG